MASIIKYFKRKIKPLKRCVGSSGQSFERNNRLASITRNDLDFTRSQMVDCNDYSRVSSVSKHPKRLSRISVFSSSGDKEGKKQKQGIMLFRKHHTENSLKSTSYFGSPEKTVSSANFQTPTAPNSSPTTNFSMSMYSTGDQYIQATSQQQQQNLNKTSQEEQKSNVAALANGASIDLIVQQSTPFNEAYQGRGRKRSLRIQPRDDQNSELNTHELLVSNKCNSNLNTPQVSSIEVDDRKVTSPSNMALNTNFNKNKCRRSITTYTSSDNKKNRIIDFFNQMDLKSNQKISTKISRTKSRAEEEEINNTANDTEDEIEKIQDAFFIDDSIVNNSDVKRQRKSRRASVDSIHSSAITINESSVTNGKAGEKMVENFVSKAKETVNSSIERMRRSVSMPGLNENNSTIFSNMSKISMIKDIEEEPDLKENRFEAPPQPPEEKMFSSRQSINQPSCFVRGQPQTRMSRNIKDMFKNVVKYQMNALNCLEKFYESQINKLEIDRSCDLALNPANRDKINEYYDSQLKILENRVHCSLNFICQKKPDEHTSRFASETNSFAKNSTKMNDEQLEQLAQLILLKQMNEQKQHTTHRANRRGVVSSKILSTDQEKDGKHQKTKSLSGLKLNLMNQNNLLPSRRSIRTQLKPNIDLEQSKEQKSELFTDTQDELESQFEDADYFFKRHLSLPYNKCDKKPPMTLKRTSNYEMKNILGPRKSRFATLDYSSSKTKYFSGRSSLSSDVSLSPSMSASSMRASDQSEQFVRIKLSDLSSQKKTHYLKHRIQPKSLMYSVESTTTSMDALDDSFVTQVSSYAQIKKLNRSPSSSNVEGDEETSRRLEESPRSFKRYSSQFQMKGSTLVQKKETQV